MPSSKRPRSGTAHFQKYRPTAVSSVQGESTQDGLHGLVGKGQGQKGTTDENGVGGLETGKAVGEISYGTGMLGKTTAGKWGVGSRVGPETATLLGLGGAIHSGVVPWTTGRGEHRAPPNPSSRRLVGYPSLGKG